MSIGARARGAVAAIGVAASVLTPTTIALADGAPVTLGEVTSHADTRTIRLRDVTAVLKSDLSSELGAIDWRAEGVRRRYRVSATLTELEAVSIGAELHVQCTVTASLLDAERGALVAIVHGRARAEDKPSAATSAERDALSVAARSAVTALPEAIRRAAVGAR